MRMQSKNKDLIPGAEEPHIRIATPLSRLDVSSIQDALRETGWKYTDKFFQFTMPNGVRPTYKMTVYQAKPGLKRSEIVQKLNEIVKNFKEDKK